MSDPNPKYLDLSRAIEAQIRKGKWDGQKMPGVRELAKLHGVSVVTASRALQVLKDRGLIRTVERAGNFRVAAPTADRWALVLRPTPGPWHAATVGLARCGFESLARHDPMHLELDLFPLGPPCTDADVRLMARRAKTVGVRGVFLLPSRHSEDELRRDELLIECCRDEGLPVVLVERNLRGHNRPLAADLVALDDLDAAARCTRHLLDHGRKRVAVVAASPTSSHNDRVAGYLYALHAARDTPRKGVDYTPVVLRQADELPVKAAFARLADEVIARKVDGVVCYGDYTAVGLMLELLARGKAVPRDVALIGFDDLPIGASFSIGVTTYAFPSERVAEQAVRLMRERLLDPGRPPIKVVVPGELVVRESCGARH